MGIRKPDHRPSKNDRAIASIQVTVDGLAMLMGQESGLDILQNSGLA